MGLVEQRPPSKASLDPGGPHSSLPQAGSCHFAERCRLGLPGVRQELQEEPGVRVCEVRGRRSPVPEDGKEPWEASLAGSWVRPEGRWGVRWVSDPVSCSPFTQVAAWLCGD